MTEKPDAPWLIALANDVSDGRAVDWDSVASSPGYAESEATVAELRSLATVVEAHRTLGGAVRPLAASEDSAPSGVWRHLVLLEPIGRGAFGAVSRAWDSHLDREVALKLLSAGSGRSPLEEARHLARVRHPNVVAVYGAEQVEQDVGIWMEFIEGETLASMVRDRGPMSAREVVGMGIDLSTVWG